MPIDGQTFLLFCALPVKMDEEAGHDVDAVVNGSLLGGEGGDAN
jgi:hypothetical protein